MPPTPDRPTASPPRSASRDACWRLRRDPRRKASSLAVKSAAIEKRRQHGRSRRVSDQRRNLGDDRACNHVANIGVETVDDQGNASMAVEVSRADRRLNLSRGWMDSSCFRRDRRRGSRAPRPGPTRVRETRGELDRLRAPFRAHQAVAADQVLRLGERAVGDEDLAVLGLEWRAAAGRRGAPYRTARPSGAKGPNSIISRPMAGSGTNPGSRWNTRMNGRPFSESSNT